MATMKLIVLAAVFVCAYAFPREPTVPLTRNTIFGDERLEGEIFENLDDETETPRNTDASAIYRLPTTTRPQHYDIYWQINMSNLSLVGTVDIQLYATRANINEIVIHADDMEIRSVNLRQNNVAISHSYTLESVTQFMRVRLDNGVLEYNVNNPTIYTLSITFASELRNDMYGIYRSWYRNTYNQTQVSWMATTQFQATSARYAFPCYDEPSFKATFNITISRPTAFRSWSCTRIRDTVDSTTLGYQDDIYQITPVMSTYLLALIVAEYESVTYSQNGLLMYEVIARPGAINTQQGQYAFDVGMELLDEMNNHTAMNFYSVHEHIKMTQASIPDFSAGAMENWGLLTYREAYIMYDENHTNSYFKQMIAYILSHEIAHMWFGNLVTCDWWDVLWLNEGFARYYQYFLTHWVEDYMGLETRFITEQIHTALLSDSANNPHPLSTVNIGSPGAVSGMFSTLSYNKGAAVIRMTEHLLGFDVHREGLRNYLVDRAFDTALPIHLFQNLQTVAVARGAIAEYGSDFSVIDYYNSWTEQPGHPVLNVQVNHQTGEMIIYQRRFNINTGYSANNLNYIVPVSFSTASNPDFDNTKPTHIIRNAITTINRGSIGDEWVVLNKQHTGYYRVNYDDYTWDLILTQLRSNLSVIHEYNRAQIVNDVFQFARSGLMTYSRAFTILSFLEFETAYAPWMAAITGFNWVRNRLVGSPYLQDLNDLIERWSRTAITQLTYNNLPNEDFMQSYLRYQLGGLLCNIGVQACRDAAVTQFRALVNAGTEVFVDNRNWVYCNALREGTEEDFDYLYQRFIEHNVYNEKIQIVWVLGCTPHRQRLYRLLDDIVEDNYIIRPQDYPNVFSGAVTGNEINTQMVFDYIQANMTTVAGAFGSIATPLSYVTARLRTDAEIDSFQTWANSSREQLGNAYTSVYFGAESARQSIRWAEENQADFTNYFVNGNLPVSLTTPAPIVTTPPVTLSPGQLVQPATPALPDPSSAVTSVASIVVLLVAALANILL